MSGDRDHQRWEDELAAYALTALDEDEAATFEAHLAVCERCRSELRWLESAVATLPAAAQQREPPSRLRRHVMATVRAEVRGRLAEGEGRRAWAPRRLNPALGLAAAGAVVLAAVGGYAIRGDGEETSTVAAEATSERVAGAEAVLTREGDSGTLEVRRLPVLRGGHVYQAWVRSGREIRPSTVFVVDRSGSGSVAIPDLAGGEELMVTREPRGGSRRPSTAPLLRAVL